MDFGRVLTRAWEIIWKHKVLTYLENRGEEGLVLLRIPRNSANHLGCSQRE